MAQPNLLAVDWSKIPAPDDDGATSHLLGAELPSVPLRATDGSCVDLSVLPRRTVLYVYPMTGQPGIALPDGWDDIPGARGCTPQSCSFRDHFADLRASGADRVFGLSTQNTNYQSEAAERLNLPFLLLSDENLTFANALRLPTMDVNGITLLKRISLIIDVGSLSQVFYPVFPPDRNASEVLTWLRQNPK